MVRKSRRGGSKIAPWLMIAVGQGWDKRTKMAAEDGLALAQYNLGNMYLNGVGEIPKDLAQALHWHKKAAEKGDVNAQFALGFVYGNGQGVPKDYK